MADSEPKAMDVDKGTAVADQPDAPSHDDAKQADDKGKQDEQKKKEKNAKKKKKKPAESKDPEDVAALRVSSSGRQRKQTSFFTPQSADSTDKEPEIHKGPGIELNEIPNISKHLAAAKRKDKYLKDLHRILFPGSHPKELTVKTNIGKFSGFVPAPSDEDKEAMEKKLSKHELRGLKDIADVLDIPHTGTKSELIDAILTFLEKPKDSGRPFKPKGKKSKSSSSSKKESGEKRTATPFIVFSQAIRPQVKKENPDATFGELGKLIGAKWQALSDKEKAKYGSSSSSSSSKKKSSSSKRSREDTESEDEKDEDDDDEAPVAKPTKKKAKPAEDKDLKTNMLAKVKGIIAKSNIDQLTMRQVKEALAKDFKQKDIDEVKDWLKAEVTQEIARIKKT